MALLDRRTALVPLRYATLPAHGPEDVVADPRSTSSTAPPPPSAAVPPASPCTHPSVPSARPEFSRSTTRAGSSSPTLNCVRAGAPVLTRRHSGFRMVTSVCEARGRLILGSLWERGIAVCEAPETK